MIMKVIHSNFSNNKSGAARAAYRIDKSLNQFWKSSGDLDSLIQVINKNIYFYTVDGLPHRGNKKYYLFLLPY